MPITDWPDGERPREKLLALGCDHLSDAELLAIFLRTGIKGKTAVDLSRELLNRFGGLRQLLEADLEDFCSAPGLGTAKFTQLQAVLELSQRYLRETLNKEQALTDSQHTKLYLKAKLRHLHHEVFACLFLDNQHRVIQFEELFRGTISSASVYPREVVKQSLHHNAAAVILAHNHPSGVAEPSQSDLAITEQLKKALSLIEVRVLDHIIVGDGEITSFAEDGLL